MNYDDVPNDSSDRMSPDAFEIEGKEVQHEVDELDDNSDRSPDQIIKDFIAEAPSGTCHSLLYRHRADS